MELYEHQKKALELTKQFNNVAYYLVVERLNFCFTEMRRPIIVELYFKYFGRHMSPVVFL